MENNILAKAALVLANIHLTGQSTALFAQFAAARTWPHLPRRVAEYLPDVVSLPGPTFTSVLGRIAVDPTDSVAALVTK